MRFTDIIPDIPPVRRLAVVSPQGDPPVDLWIWLRCLQGLANRQEPHLYVIQDQATHRGKPRDLYERHWLDYYTRTFGLPVAQVGGPDEMLARYKHLVGGYIRYDNQRVIQTQNLAITRCGLEGLLPVSVDQEPWMRRHGIPRRDNLVGAFRDDWDAAEWALDHLWPHCNKHLFANLCVHRPFWYALEHCLEDFIVYHRALALDLPLSRQTRRTLVRYRRMLESAEPPGIQMNWHCILDQEKEYIAEAAERGFFSLCSVATPNLTIHGGVGDTGAAYTQPLPDPKTCRAERDKVYVCLYVSDGDATWAMTNMHSGSWLAPERGSFKLGWGLLPYMAKLMPGMLRYYHETRTPGDCFWGPSSGVGYTYSHLWPEPLVNDYLRETRRLLDQTGQHGCNMVNWFLRDWWREVEDDAAIRREQEMLKDGPGLVCGLGGSPFATSYLKGPIPKLHSVHIANVGRDNVGDIVRFAAECPTRPLFMFLFAQIAPGVLKHIAGEMPEFARHPEIEILSMDEFFLTLQDGIRQGLVREPLYERTPALTETWLGAPGRHRLPYCRGIAAELAAIAGSDPATRRRMLAEPGWTELVSREVEGVARDRDRFLVYFKGKRPVTEEEEPDTLLYVAFTVAWTVLRAALEAQGIYANNRHQCLADFQRTCGEWVDAKPFAALWQAWDNWEAGAPPVETTAGWCREVAQAAEALLQRLGPKEAEEFTAWPPPTI